MSNKLEGAKATALASSFSTCEHDIPSDKYCWECVKAAARQKCIDKGEGWRYGVGKYKEE